MVLLVRLRDPEVQKAHSISEILPFADENEVIAREIVHYRGKNVLFLLDGWDELPQELQRESVFRTLIEAPHKYKE